MHFLISQKALAVELAKTGMCGVSNCQPESPGGLAKAGLIPQWSARAILEAFTVRSGNFGCAKTAGMVNRHLREQFVVYKHCKNLV